MNELLNQLEALPKSPFPLHSWPMSPGLMNQPEILEQVARITRSVSAFFQWVDKDRLEKQLALEPEWFAIELSPFHPKWDNYTWEAGDWDRHTGAPVDRYLDWVQSRAAFLRKIVADQKTIIILDHERWPVNVVADGLLNEVVDRIRLHFAGALFTWYGWGRPGHRHLSTNVYSDFACGDMYDQPGSVLNAEHLESMIEVAATHHKLRMPWVSLGACYDRRDYVPKGKPWHRPHSKNVIAPVQRGQTWGLGRESAAAEVDAVCFWPELFDPAIPDMLPHFIAFVQGIHEIRFPHEEA